MKTLDLRTEIRRNDMEYNESCPERVYIKNQEDRETIAVILARNGYTVRLTKVKQEGKTTTLGAVEWWGR